MYKATERQDPSLSDNRTTRFPISIKVTFAISNSPTANVTKMLLNINTGECIFVKLLQAPVMFHRKLERQCIAASHISCVEASH